MPKVRKPDVPKPTYAELNAKGEYQLVDPLDYIIIGHLPDEGELVMGYYPYAKTAKQLVRDDMPGLKGSMLVGPIRRLLEQKLIVRAGSRSVRENAYQRTPLGKKLYDEWASKNKGAGTKSAPDKSGGNNS